MNNFISNVYDKMSLCRHFENYVFKKIQDKTIKIPVYLSAGQESAPCSISAYLKDKNISPNILV